MRNFVRELGFFLLFLAVAICLAPAVLQAMGLTSEASYANRLEELFLIQISFIVVMALIAMQYLVRFLATTIIKWTGGQAAGGDTP